MKSGIRKITAMLLAAILVCCSGETKIMAAYAADSADEQLPEYAENVMGYVQDDLVVEAPLYYITDPEVLMATDIPEKYDMRDYGYITSVKNQNPYGLCWAFSTIACIESNLIMNGYADSSIDLSEKHLGYFSFANVADKLGNTVGDSTSIIDKSKNYLTVGGNTLISTNTLANWKGAVREETMPYSDFDSTHTAQEAYDNNVYHLDNTYIVPVKSRDYIKQLIMEKGAAEIGLYYSDSYMNIMTNAYCTKGISSSTHSVTIIGWDDTYSRDNFLADYAPEKDGAWLIKNSWGSDWRYGDEGYFWLSYEDSSLNAEGNEATFFEATPVKRDYNIYQYDGSSALSYFEHDSGLTVANVYAADDDEYLKEVSFYTMQCNISYKVQVYKDVNSVPTDGTACFAQEVAGVAPAAGYHTVVLPERVLLEKGESFAIAVTLMTGDNSKAIVSVDRTSANNIFSYVNANKAGQSFVRLAGNIGWQDLGSSLDVTARIKGITESVVDPGGSCGDNLEWTLNDEGVLTISGTGDMTDWESKNEVPWVAFRDEITEIAVEDGAVSIGDYAFCYCDNLKKAVLPDSITELGVYAFAYSQALEEIEIPDNTEIIGGNAFTRCRGLTELIVPDSVTMIGSNAFAQCNNLTAFSIPANLTHISYGLLEGCSKLKSVEIPVSVTAIDDRAFAGCDRLTDVYFSGTREEWQAVEISENRNDPLFAAVVHCSDDRTPGDVTGDGDISMLDSTILRRWLAGWEGVVIDEANADVTGDGTVTMLDSTILRRYLAGWEDVKLK